MVLWGWTCMVQTPNTMQHHFFMFFLLLFFPASIIMQQKLDFSLSSSDDEKRWRDLMASSCTWGAYQQWTPSPMLCKNVLMHRLSALRLVNRRKKLTRCVEMGDAREQEKSGKDKKKEKNIHWWNCQNPDVISCQIWLFRFCISVKNDGKINQKKRPGKAQF